MIVIRLLVVALLIVLAAQLLAWAVTGNRRYLHQMVTVVRFALVVALVLALGFIVERFILR